MGRALKRNLDGGKNRPVVVDDENARHSVSLTNFAALNPKLHRFLIQAKTDTDAEAVMVDVNLLRCSEIPI
jgi:hypothetical protein